MGWRSPRLPIRGGRQQEFASRQNRRLSFLSAKRVSKTLRQIKRSAQSLRRPEVFLRAEIAAQFPLFRHKELHRQIKQRNAMPLQWNGDPAIFATTQLQLWRAVR